MSAFARWSRRDLAALASGGVVLAGVLGYVGSQAGASAGPALTANLSGGPSGIDAEFARRVVGTFPVGSRAANLAAELKRQGFTSTDWLSPQDGEGTATRREAGQACAPVARVRWRADPDGRVSVIRGTFRDEGCP